MAVDRLNTFKRLNGRPCTLEQLLQEFGKLKDLLVNAQNGLIPGFGGGSSGGGGNDDPPGTVKMWALAASAIPDGWAVMDGTANAAPDGSGIDMRGRFAKGIATAPSGTPGGSTTYGVTGSITGGGSTSTSSVTVPFSFTTSSYSYPTPPAVDAPSYGGSVSVDTSITWPGGNATSNGENFSGTPAADETINGSWGAGGAGGTVATTGGPSLLETNRGDTGTAVSVASLDHTHETSYTELRHSHTLSGLSHTHEIATTELAHTHTIAEASLDHTHTISNIAHTHGYTGNTDTHSHTIDTSGLGFTGNNITGVEPPFVELIYIERLDIELPADWDYYANNWSVAPSFNATITGGDVYDYTLDGTTRYRFIPSPYDPMADTFYETFDGVTLSDPLATRG